MSEPQQQQQQQQPSIFDGCKYLYAEQLFSRGRPARVVLTIREVVGGVKFPSERGTAEGCDVHFVERKKVLGVVSVTVRRQLVAACGTEVLAEMAGRKVMLYPEPSKKSPSGWAIRVAPAPQ